MPCGLTSYGLIPGSVRQRESASMGGKVTGPRNAASGHMSAIQKLSDCSAAGKLGASAYWDDVKSGKKDRIKRMFITNGIESKMIPIDDNIPEGWRRGRTI